MLMEVEKAKTTVMGNEFECKNDNGGTEKDRESELSRKEKELMTVAKKCMKMAKLYNFMPI